MEVLDTSIANVALPHMAGDLGASNDESTWVLTSYLVSNAIVLPISGWLAGLFGRKRFFLLCIFLFTVSSLLCGIAPSLGMLILFRVIQGVGGGGLQPMAQAILADTFPPQKRGLAFALYGITTIMAPTIGPTLGGWLTDNYSWRWIFYINLPVGIVDPVSGAAHGGGSAVHRPHAGAPGSASTISASVCSRSAWARCRFCSTKARKTTGSVRISSSLWSLISAVCLDLPGVVGVAYQDARHRHAHVQKLQLRRGEPDDVLSGCAFVQQPGDDAPVPADAMGYTAQSAGLVLSGASLIILLEMPIVGQLTTKVPAKYIMAFGWICLAFGMYYSTKGLDLLISFQSASRLRMVQAFGLGFLFVPITLSAYIGVPSEKGNSVSGLVNFMRNIGSSVGTSMVTTVLARREQFHQSLACVPCHELRSGFSRSGATDSAAAHSCGSQPAGRAGSGVWTHLPVDAGAVADARVY